MEPYFSSTFRLFLFLQFILLLKFLKREMNLFGYGIWRATQKLDFCIFTCEQWNNFRYLLLMNGCEIIIASYIDRDSQRNMIHVILEMISCWICNPNDARCSSASKQSSYFPLVFLSLIIQFRNKNEPDKSYLSLFSIFILLFFSRKL